MVARFAMKTYIQQYLLMSGGKDKKKFLSKPKLYSRHLTLVQSCNTSTNMMVMIVRPHTIFGWPNGHTNSQLQGHLCLLQGWVMAYGCEYVSCSSFGHYWACSSTLVVGEGYDHNRWDRSDVSWTFKPISHDPSHCCPPLPPPFRHQMITTKVWWKWPCMSLNCIIYNLGSIS